MRRRLLFLMIPVGLFVSAIAIAQYPKQVPMETLVMNGVPVATVTPTPIVFIPKFVNLDLLIMTGVPATTTTTTATPFIPRRVAMDPLVMTGIPTTIGEVR